MVPLEKVLARPASRTPAPIAAPKPRARAPQAPAPRAPRRFRVTDVVTGELLAEDASARATVDLLKDVRSAVDVKVYVFEPDEQEWRLLSLREQRSLWALRDR